MQQKPQRWNVAPALIAPEARRLWKDVAFVLPCFQGAHLGGNVLLGPTGAPLRGVPLTAGSTAEKRATPYGCGIGISGASNLLQRDNYEPIVTSDGAGTGDFTMMVLANPVAEARLSFPVSQSTGASNPGVLLGFNFNASTSAAASGSFGLRTRDAVGNTSVTATSIIDGEYHVFSGRRSGTTVEVFADGASRASATGTVRDFVDGTAGLAIGQRAEHTADRIDTACNIVYATAWNRALTDAEMRLLARDPFIMIRPYAEWPGLWTPISAGIESIGNAFAGAAAFAQHATMRFSSVKAFGGSSAQGLSRSGRKSTSAAASGAAAHGGAKTSRSASSSAIAGGSAFSASGIIGAIASAVAGAAAYAGSFTSRISSANAFAGARASSAAKTSRSAVAKVVAGARASAGGIASRIASAVAAAGAWARSVALPKIIAYAARIIVRDDARRIIVKDDARRIIVKDDIQ